MSALSLLFSKKFVKEGNVFCEEHEEEIVLSLECIFLARSKWPSACIVLTSVVTRYAHLRTWCTLPCSNTCRFLSFILQVIQFVRNT